MPNGFDRKVNMRVFFVVMGGEDILMIAELFFGEGPRRVFHGLPVCTWWHR